jgi:hypothetical protein
VRPFLPDTIKKKNLAFSVRQQTVGNGAYWVLRRARMEIGQVGDVGLGRRPVGVSDEKLQQIHVELQSVIKVFYEIFEQLTPAERAFYNLPASSVIQ